VTSASAYVRPYFDSGVFISWLKGSDIGTLADGSTGDRTPISEFVLNEAESGKYPIVTSYFTMAEVFKKKGDGNPPLSDERNGQIMEYFNASEWIKWVEVDHVVGEEANQLLIRYRDQRLRPADAIHLASALRAKCEVLLTWDGPFSAIKHPNIRIEFPQVAFGPQGSLFNHTY
jgi:predicted nucleic acid-binding protein